MLTKIITTQKEVQNKQCFEFKQANPLISILEMNIPLKPNPPDYRRDLVLSDGTRFVIRPITCDDKQALLQFHSRLSPETRFLRYHYSKGELTEKDLQNFCDLDYENAMGLVVESTGDKNAEIVAVGRYIRIPPDHTAEIAIVVQDSLQGKGIGTQILRHLAILALHHHIHHFVGEVLRNNGKMMAVFNRSDPGLECEVDGPGTCNIRTSVEQIINGY
jgi:RimJ/RimL family protein N-acetyltransferase